MSNIKADKFTSPHNLKEFDPIKSLVEIRKEFLNNDSVKARSFDDFRVKVATFNLLMDGLWYLYNETSLGDNMDDEAFTALNQGWWDLKKFIQDREEVFSKMHKLAVHGDQLE